MNKRQEHNANRKQYLCMLLAHRDATGKGEAEMYMYKLTLETGGVRLDNALANAYLDFCLGSEQ